MNLLQTLQGLGPPIAYYVPLARMAGSVNAGLLLCQMVYWSPRGAAGSGWFYKRRDELRYETGLSFYEQDSARAALRELGLLREYYARRDGVLFFKIDTARLEELWEARVEEAPPERIKAPRIDGAWLDQQWAKQRAGPGPVDLGTTSEKPASRKSKVATRDGARPRVAKSASPQSPSRGTTRRQSAQPSAGKDAETTAETPTERAAAASQGARSQGVTAEAGGAAAAADEGGPGAGAARALSPDQAAAVAALVKFGFAESDAAGLVGGGGHDAKRVRGVINRARREGPRDAFAWVASALKHGYRPDPDPELPWTAPPSGARFDPFKPAPRNATLVDERSPEQRLSEAVQAGRVTHATWRGEELRVARVKYSSSSLILRLDGDGREGREVHVPIGELATIKFEGRGRSSPAA